MTNFKKGDRVVLTGAMRDRFGEIKTKVKSLPGDSEYDIYNFEGAENGVLLDTEHSDGRGLWTPRKYIALQTEYYLGTVATDRSFDVWWGAVKYSLGQQGILM